ncbi:hypothetical protein [Rhodocaloribacter sp.]
MIRRSRSFLLLAGIGVIRFAAAGVGPVYPRTGAHPPGVPAEVSSDRPSASALMPGNGTPTLVLFAHPRGAAIGDPASLIAHPVRPHGSFHNPADEPDARVKTALPVVTPHVDPEALEARHFGAMTSGPMLRFSGGITGARGRRGDHAGPPALDESITRNETDRKTTVAFGCARYPRHTISESS